MNKKLYSDAANTKEVKDSNYLGDKDGITLCNTTHKEKDKVTEDKLLTHLACEEYLSLSRKGQIKVSNLLRSIKFG